MVPLARYRSWCDLCGGELLVTDVQFEEESIAFSPGIPFSELDYRCEHGDLRKLGIVEDGTAECDGCGEVESLSDLKLD
jgi:hypothetical protein